MGNTTDINDYWDTCLDVYYDEKQDTFTMPRELYRKIVCDKWKELLNEKNHELEVTPSFNRHSAWVNHENHTVVLPLIEYDRLRREHGIYSTTTAISLLGNLAREERLRKEAEKRLAEAEKKSGFLGIFRK